MSRVTTIFLPLALLLLLAGCGGGGEDAPKRADTIPGAAQVTIEDEEGAAAPGPFQSTEFEPPIAFNVPQGWRVREEFGMIQAFRGAGEAQALTFESGEGQQPEQVIEQMRGTPDIEAGEVQQVTIGGHDAHMFEATPQYATPLEGSEYYALGQGPLRVWVLDVEGALVTVFAESSILRTERREAEEIAAAFFSEVDQILATLEFGSPQS